MLHHIIDKKKRQWLRSERCAVSSLITYMKAKGKLRSTQIEAIETYLFLKIEGGNRPLWQLFAEGFFTEHYDLDRLNISVKTRDFLKGNTAAHALFDFARQKASAGSLLPELEKLIVNTPESINYGEVIRNIFYNVSYADYLMSLPMGAGKTYLMAAFIYLDLYFADLEPDNPIFAHNFLVLIPSGLKSSLVPSLKTIKNFDPSWVIPEPAAGRLWNLLDLEILDEQKTGKKSTQARNPNAQKINASLPDPMGKVFVVNAEKVILSRMEVTAQLKVIEHTADEKDKLANELRNLIGKIPNLSIMIDEVHHAAKDDIKLRQVVNRWQAQGNITTVLGFSGTPYLSKPDKITVSKDAFFKFSQITNTVYYYPLVTAIQTFLKNPTVKIGANMDRFQIIRNGVEDFQRQFGVRVYGNGSIAKLAIYCSNIEILEDEVFPFLTNDLQIDPGEILRFHKGNKAHPQPEGSEREFRSLDQPISKKRYILLVQVGKEGWDCPSLTGVILSQKGDSPKNMVLQTSCRCLRQVDDMGGSRSAETALIWLNDYNAKTLNEQLKKEQQTSIEEINKLGKAVKTDGIDRFARIGYLKLPPVDFFQLRINYQAIEEEENADTKQKLKALVADIGSYKAAAMVTTAELGSLDEGEIALLKETGVDAATYNAWVYGLAKESFGQIGKQQFRAFDYELKPIFDTITYGKDGDRYWNELYDLYAIDSRIRLAFSIKRTLSTEEEVIPKKARLLLVDKLGPVDKNAKLYPDAADTTKILTMDESGESTEVDMVAAKVDYDRAKQALDEQGLGHMMPPWEVHRKGKDHSLAVRAKDRTFHYLPYNFAQSTFEMDMLVSILRLIKSDGKQPHDLEVYYNGERGLTEFVIDCFAQRNGRWGRVGAYTTDFLIIRRTEGNEIHKVMMVETKGAGYSNDPAFIKRRKYVETDFLQRNNDKFGYPRFDFLYLEDSADLAKNLQTLSERVELFFND